VHARRAQQLRQQEVEVHGRVEMGVQETPLGHAPHNAPERRALHAGLGVREHHAGEEREVLLLREQVLGGGRPCRRELAGADSVDYVAGLAGDGGEVVAEGGVWNSD
jgi:hypothetical protein